jgi:copper transport protein
LALVLSRGERWPLAASAVPRFSTLAVGSVAVLIAAGTVNGYLQVRTWRGLWETEYGLLLLAKIILVLPLLALGAYNNRYAVPRLRRQIASVLEQRRFLRAVGVELALMVTIVSVTAVLVSAPPARTEIGMHEAFETVVELGPFEGHVMVDPAMAGPNTIRIALEGEDGAAEDVTEVRLAATLPSENIGPLTFEAEEAQPEDEASANGEEMEAPAMDSAATWVVRGAILPIAGDWQLRLEVARGEFELDAENLTVPVEEPDAMSMGG